MEEWVPLTGALVLVSPYMEEVTLIGVNNTVVGILNLVAQNFQNSLRE